MVAVVALLFHLYVYEPLPPLATTVAVPFPLQLTLVLLVLKDKAVGCVTVTEPVVWHEFASVTRIVYVPGLRLAGVAETVSPLLHAYTYGEVPPPTVAVALPLLLPLQLTLLWFMVTERTPG